jgi:hypothetical protein
MNFYDLIHHAELLAIGVALSPTPESIYSIRCREYSDRFRTPLHEVYDLDPMFVLKNLYEDKYQPSEIHDEMEDLLDKLYTMQDPTYSRMNKQDLEDMVDAVMNKEIKRLAKTKDPITGELKNPLLAKKTSDKEVKPIPPKGGSMSFESLEMSDEAAEGNKGGFKD